MADALPVGVPVKLVVRISPSEGRKGRKAPRAATDLRFSKDKLSIAGDAGAEYGNLDYVFPPESSNTDVYERTLAPLIANYVGGGSSKGYNVSLICLRSSKPVASLELCASAVCAAAAALPLPAVSLKQG